MTQPADQVKLSIDGKELSAPKGMLLVEAAKLIGLHIPVFCYEPRLKPVGACRMCLVQVEKLPRLQTACTTPVAGDMIVHTTTPDVIAAQNGVLELMLANHPLDCPICDKGGECPLQDNTFSYGPGASRFTEQKNHKEKAFPLGDRIVLDRERCIMCYRCVRFHQEIPGDEALAAIQRGVDSEIATLDGEPYNSMFAGNTIELCPVGALTSRQYRFKARPWDLVRTPSICNGCSVGCNVQVHSRTENVLRLISRENQEIDNGWLCDRGRFETLPSPPTCRPATPMLRQDGALVAVSWERALERSAELLSGSGGILASAGLSNEAFFLLQRIAQRRPVALWPPVGEVWPVQGNIANLGLCKSIVSVGLDVWNELPILALWIRKAVQAGGKLVVIGETNGLWRDTAHWLQGDSLSLVDMLLAALQHGVDAGTPAEIAAILATLNHQVPAAVLAHPSLVSGGRHKLEALASALGVNAASGLFGAPLLGANGRGAHELAPDLVAGDADRVLASPVLLAIGDERWSEHAGSFARLIVATSQEVPDDGRVEVVLPMAHPYERQGTLINLEGRLQHQEGGAAPPPHARGDWSILAGISAYLGIPSPGAAGDNLEGIRASIVAEHPELASAFREQALIARV